VTPTNFSLRQLQYAVAVADSLNFRKAAERCNVSQPSLSAQLAALEDALGVKLFERDRRRVLLTPSGQALVERSRAILRDAADLMEAARRAADPLAGTMRIGVIPTISPYLLPPISPWLRKTYPRLRVVWVEEKTALLVRYLAEGTLDGALVALESGVGDLESEVIAKDPFVLAAPPENPFGRLRSPAELRDIRKHDVLLLDEGHCMRDQVLSLCAKTKAHEGEFRATSLSTLVQMVADRAGITLLPKLSVPTEARRAKLKIRAFAEPAPHRTIALVWRKTSALGPALRRVARVIRRAYPKA
jgi:LysR family transcriptional regulator, hydrogen peroxide-inducible genes activator